MQTTQERRAHRPVSRARRGRKRFVPYLFLLPNLVLFVLFMAWPIAYGFYMSLHEWALIGTPSFAGLDNYAELLGDTRFWRSLGYTVVYAIGTVPPSMALGLGAAVLLNRRMVGRPFFRAVIFVPVIVSLVVVGLSGQWIFNESYGVANTVLRDIGIGPLPWLTAPRWAMTSVILMTLWTRIGFCMVIYLAALQSIPGDLYEAAHVDGATGWGRFRWVTWPLIGPTNFLLTVINVIISFHVFDLIFIMTGGGPGFSTTVLVQYVYELGFELGRMGYATAVAFALYLIILLFTLALWRASKQGQLR